ncbi:MULTISPECIES: hypothetical protein [unclassified Bradyrhizobium]|uniref:hypothetical protein n=1 Tax=unclassified Bradyrhizobium TaxID=2631580 RepID=UPI0020B3019E|nr:MULTISPECIES: hypothetical protein [unclassified Bradyrhizobium]MCP3381734.1 hypothetical protein [Bradyrhizobium sp. CCGUVB4N]MCP3442814.1 hypothetical protein [Bradyrhizobium sp. CCGUVB14]WFU78664.1 hypothetical protein QA645_29605 [Bradyrhizobium sp. CIAT3101]
MTRNILFGLVAANLLAAGLLFSGTSRATQLITEDEAKLPPPKGAVTTDRRGILRGPKVEFVSPGDSVASPLKLQLKFESFGGAKIDPDSVKVIFLRSPNVDLTARVKPFVQADGINMQDAELPPGDYTVRVDIKDSDGRPGTAIFTLKVAPK